VPITGVPDGIVLYDGVCVLCSGMFRFVVARDASARFRFAQVQDPYGGWLAGRLGIAVEAPETVALVQDGRAWFKSDAALLILARLPWWSWTASFRLVPRGLRDWIYDRIAGNRYRLFGRTDACMLPDPVLARHVVARTVPSGGLLDGPDSVYARALGPAFERLPAPVRALHRPARTRDANGMVTVEAARGWLARLVARALGFPVAEVVAPIRLTVISEDGGERWERAFAGSCFVSRLSAGARPGRLIERVGPFAFDLEPAMGLEGIAGMTLRRWHLGPFPVPLALAPRVQASERVDGEGRFAFDIALDLPFGLGRIVRYHGWLVPVPDGPGPAGASDATAQDSSNAPVL
jgi:predicted DCC family thiol-disulfide oxidoreductase YuxK